MTLWSIFLEFLRENIVHCQKTFFLCRLYIYTFPIASFNFFGELIDLGSKLGLQRAQFRSWPPELGSKPNSKSLIYIIIPIERCADVNILNKGWWTDVQTFRWTHKNGFMCCSLPHHSTAVKPGNEWWGSYVGW